LQSEEAAEKWKEEEEFARQHHFLISTAVIPGIYNSPHKVCATSRLFNNAIALMHLGDI